eukprot:Gb_19129 [translate_table: standard]
MLPSQEDNFGEAYAKFTQAQTVGGFQPKIVYDRAVCLYHMKRFSQALKLLDEIFQHGIREYPELGVGSYMEGMELCSVGNSSSLKESHLIEAFNLKHLGKLALMLLSNFSCQLARVSLV